MGRSNRQRCPGAITYFQQLPLLAFTASLLLAVAVLGYFIPPGCCSNFKRGQQVTPASLALPGSSQNGLNLKIITLEVLKEFKSDPNLWNTHPEAAEAPLFQAAPWLLPPNYPHLDYTGVHDLFALAALRARQKGGQSRALSVTFFSSDMVRMLENCVFSMVKFGGVDNYVVAVWSKADLEKCAELNLPCADASAFLPAAPEPQDNSTAPPATPSTPSASPSQGIVFNSLDFKRIGWMKTAIISALVHRGFAVHCTDGDLGYAHRSVWDSYLSFMEEEGVNADFAIQLESDNPILDPPVNTGNYVVMPSAGGKALMRSWVDLTETLVGRISDQAALARRVLPKQSKNFVLCTSMAECSAAKNSPSGIAPPVAVVRGFKAPWLSISQTDANTSVCPLVWNQKGSSTLAPVLDPCEPGLLYVHPVCVFRMKDRTGVKLDILKKTGFWYLSDDCLPYNGSVVERYLPMELTSPGAEARLQRCTPSLAFNQ